MRACVRACVLAVTRCVRATTVRVRVPSRHARHSMILSLVIGYSYPQATRPGRVGKIQPLDRPTARDDSAQRSQATNHQVVATMAGAMLLASAALLMIVSHSNEPDVLLTVGGCECQAVSWDL